MTYGLRIDPDGTVTRIEQPDVAAVARAEIEALTVVCLRSPWTADAVYVGWVADWGRFERLPLNIKAWALYGASPIVGPMWVALDLDDDEDPEYFDADRGYDVAGERKMASRDELPDALVTMVEGDGWLVPVVYDAMRSMLSVLDDGAPVPEWNGPA